MKSINTTFILLALASATPACAQQSGGKASYYANSLHGRKMSNGQPYDRNRLTCAHRTLPFGTKLRVTNPSNGKQVIVEVTDRGPYAHGRIIDLSYAAARELGMIAAGVASIRMEILPNGVTLPYPSDGSAYDGTSFDTPRIEYGTAGVCYEFIPEWSQEEEDRKKETGDRNQEEGDRRQENTKKPAAEKQQAKPQPKKGASKNWTDFFDKLKDIF